MTRHQHKRVLRVVLVAGLLVLLLFWPSSYLASPRWDVVVVDGTGKPYAGILVRVFYRNYSAETDGHELSSRTDEQGRASFPAQYARASVARRIFYSGLAAMAGVHASFGRHAYVDAFFDDGRVGFATNGQYVVDWHGWPRSMRSRIVVG
jgi:hypothetical protein